MKVIGKTESKERCTEAGWYAYDILLDEDIDEEFIKNLKRFGSLLYMPMLKKPFFKVESSNYLLKGMKGEPFFRLAIHKDYEELVENIVQDING
ncbi:putative restriction endonuclease [Aequitasia blattaphilus]|uniref:Uncharacterized protein n=1 Tax=Aequitasia blattaphilus TaxID=2949332 RepID=A0ABT1EDZ3_9FIRM|nr:hypothetical protein [Aequitasia blattaphilus]MCP1103056.1 hypothetical protein [Aequitasia blattaphilus]MCR8615696.1 hypothetical protein [Aequitasia blattaphilus]